MFKFFITLFFFTSFSFGQVTAAARGLKSLFNTFKKPPPTKIIGGFRVNNNPLIKGPNLIDVYKVPDNFYYNKVTLNHEIINQRLYWKNSEISKKIGEIEYFFGSKKPSYGEVEEMIKNRAVREKATAIFGEFSLAPTHLYSTSILNNTRTKKNLSSNIIEIIWDYQKRKEIPFLNYGSKKIEKIYQISPEGFDSFLKEYKNLEAKLKIQESLSIMTGMPNSLKFVSNRYRYAWKQNTLYNIKWSRRYTGLSADELLFKKNKLKKTENILERQELQKEIELLQDKLNQNRSEHKNSRDFLLKSYPDIEEQLKKLDFENLNKVVETETNRFLDAISSLENKLNFLGFTNREESNILLSNYSALNSELDFLRTRMKKSIVLLKNDFPQLRTINNYEKLNLGLAEEISKYEQKLEKIINNSEGNLSDKLRVYSKIHSQENSTNMLDTKVRNLISKESKEKVYYVKVGKKHERFTQESIDIKIKKDSIRKKNLIKLFKDANLYITKSEDLSSDISKLRDNMRNNYSENDIKVLLFSKYENKRAIRKKNNKVLDSLRGLFGKKALKVLLNYESEKLKANLVREFKKNRGNTFFMIGHVEKGAFVNKSNSKYHIPLSYIEELSKKYDVNYFIGGCSSSYYNVPGTTDLINDLNFGVHLSRALKNNDSFEGLMKSLSNQKINGGIGKVKIILKEDSFENTNFHTSEVLFQKEKKWNKLVDIFFEYFNF